MPRDTSKTQISATVLAEVKAAVGERAEQEDRDPSRILLRALTVYLSLPLDEAERMVQDARGGKADG